MLEKNNFMLIVYDFYENVQAERLKKIFRNKGDSKIMNQILLMYEEISLRQTCFSPSFSQ